VLWHISYDSDTNTVTAFFEDGSSATKICLSELTALIRLFEGPCLAKKRQRQPLYPTQLSNLHVNYGDAEKALFVRQKHPSMTHAIHLSAFWLWISSGSFLFSPQNFYPLLICRQSKMSRIQLVQRHGYSSYKLHGRRKRGKIQRLSNS
jgi:hypothetical protein